MTKRHFNAIAAAIRNAKPDLARGIDARMAWGRTLIAIADVCAQENPRFDEQRFKTACGLGED